jgi:hypothetical protein
MDIEVERVLEAVGKRIGALKSDQAARMLPLAG